MNILRDMALLQLKYDNSSFRALMEYVNKHVVVHIDSLIMSEILYAKDLSKVQFFARQLKHKTNLASLLSLKTLNQTSGL
jgi:hypothetical protein